MSNNQKLMYFSAKAGMHYVVFPNANDIPDHRTIDPGRSDCRFESLWSERGAKMAGPRP